MSVAFQLSWNFLACDNKTCSLFTPSSTQFSSVWIFYGVITPEWQQIRVNFNQNIKLTVFVVPDAYTFETLNDSPTQCWFTKFWQLPQNSSSADQVLMILQKQSHHYHKYTIAASVKVQKLRLWTPVLHYQWIDRWHRHDYCCHNNKLHQLRDVVSHSTTIKKNRQIWSVVSASHTMNFLEGPHCKWEGPQTYWPATTYTHHPYRSSQVPLPHCVSWSIHGSTKA